MSWKSWRQPDQRFDESCCYPLPYHAGASIYWLLSAGLNGLPVGAIAQQHGDDAAELAAELLPLAQRYVLDSGRRQGLGELQQVRDQLPCSAAN